MEPQKIKMTEFAYRHPQYYLYNVILIIFLIAGTILTTFSIESHRLQVFLFIE